MKHWILALLISVIVLASGCCAPCRQAQHTPYPHHAYAHHSHPHRALFAEWQHPLIDANGQYRLMGDKAFRHWQCQPATPTPVPE